MTERGFSLVELLVSSAIALAAAASVFGLLSPMHAAFAVEPERADMRQRLRVAADTLYRDLAAAVASDSGQLPAVPPIAPYRMGAGDAPGTVRTDAVSVARAGPPGAAGPTRYAFFVETDSTSGVPRLRRARIGGANVPVVDHVVSVTFEYFGGPPGLAAPLDSASFADGPWHPDPFAADRYDMDLLGIRTIRVALRVEAAADDLRGTGALFLRPGPGRGARLVPDLEARFDVSLRAGGRP